MFVPAFDPFKPPKKLTRCVKDLDGREHLESNYPYEYGGEVFRSSVEARWAKTFQELGLGWEYEPLRFDMGTEERFDANGRSRGSYYSYTPDFVVPSLLVPGRDRPLYIEVKQFPDLVDVGKYVAFTDWYDCDLLVLAHRSGGVLHPRQKYFLITRCPRCGFYDCWSCNDRPAEDHVPPSGFARDCCSTAQANPAWMLERMVVGNYFLIQSGAIQQATIDLPQAFRRPRSDR